MDKRHLHHLYTVIRPIKPQYFAAVFLVSGAVMVLALRNNNLHMVHLKEAVYTADKNGGDTAKALQNLQHYVTGHMNTNLSSGSDTVYPPIQLKYTYDRLVQAESDKLATTNTQLYNDAQKYCEAQNSADFSGRNRVPCIQQYVKDHGQPLKSIPDSLYKFDFVSPSWSPDLAGWSIITTVLSGLLLLVVVSLRQWFKKASK
jgi:preprotein translocase subunit SecF